MDNDLKQKAVTAKAKHINHRCRQPSHDYFTKISNTLINNQSNDKRQKLMKVIIATAQATSDNDSTNHSNLLFKNLVRIKRFNRIKGTQKSSLIRKKKKSSFRIQKTYRFRNYRLRCIRLRQSQLKERRKYPKSKQSIRKIRKKSTMISSSSCAESSESNLNFSTNNNTSSGEDTLSLVECFKQTKFLNSSDTREEEEESRREASKLFNRTDKKHFSRIHCLRPKKLTFKKKLNRLSNRSLLIKESRYLNVRKSQFFCDCHYCNFKPNNSTAEQLKRKRLIKEDELADVKKLKLKCESSINNCNSPDYSLSSIQSSGEDNLLKDDLVDSSIKSDDTNDSTNSSVQLNKDLKAFNFRTRFKSKSLSEIVPMIATESFKSNEKNHSSNEEEDDLDDTGADDEQSDWPANENTCSPSNDTNKSFSQQKTNSSNSSSTQVDYLSDAFKVIPWWNEMEQDYERNEALLKNKHKLTKNESNYEKLNYQNIESDNSEFDSILNGAFNLMSASSKKTFHERMKSKLNTNRNKARSNSLTQDCIATKSSADLDSLTKESNNLANKPLGEDNKGNIMLQQMGWQPGTTLGLNRNNTNLINPIVAVKRPNRIGLGFKN